MRLYLVRHAPTEETGSVLSGRITGISLSSPGRELASSLAAHLAALRPAAVYSSPLDRCVETAEILGSTWRLEPVLSPALIEADYGRWSGRRLASLHRLKAWRNLMAAPSRFRFPDGESLREVQNRAVTAVEDMAAAHRNRSVVAVTHADVIRVVLAHHLGMPLDLVHRLHVAPASISVIDLPASGMPPVVTTVNAGGAALAP